MALTAQTIEIYKGAAKDYILTVVDSSNVAVDLTSALVTMTVRKEACHASALFTKTTADIAEIEKTDPTNGEVTIYIVSGDTSALATGTYTYDIWVTISSKPYPVVPPSDFKVLQAVTTF